MLNKRIEVVNRYQTDKNVVLELRTLVEQYYQSLYLV